MKAKVLLSWSSGKDSAWALQLLRQQPGLEVVGLVTTITQAFNRVAMHGVRWEFVVAQAESVGLPLWPVLLPWPCSNPEYEARMRAFVDIARKAGVTAIAFGDLYLPDIREYRERLLAGTGITALFPLWRKAGETRRLAETMLAAGLRAILTCVDPRRLDPSFCGRAYDSRLLNELPPGIDPCGENGEFHTFCYDGPMFDRPIAVEAGVTVQREGFYFAELHSKNPHPADGDSSGTPDG